MTRESILDLNKNTLIGYTDKRGTAWHYRGTHDNHFKGEVPIERVRQLFCFTAEEAPFHYTARLDDGTVKEMVHPSQKLYYRSDTGDPLGIHGKGHNPHQYQEWLLHNVMILLGQRLSIGQAGLLRGGAVAWVSIEMADTLTHAGVQFRPQLLAATSFDGSLATTNKNVSTIVVCDNTLTAGLSESASVYKVKHTANSKFEEDKARDALGLVEAYTAAFTAQLEELTNSKVTESEWDKFLQVYIPIPEEKGRSRTLAQQKKSIFQDYWHNDPRVSPWRGTQFGVLQAANTWLHHESSVKNVTRQDRNAWRAVTAKKADSIEHFDRQVLQTLQRLS